MAKRVVAFDLDGTLAESKSPITPEMSSLLCELLKKYTVAVVSGGAFPQYQKQFLENLNCPDEETLENLFLFPTNGSAFYARKSETWECVYEETLAPDERERIIGALTKALEMSGMVLPTPSYGPIIEDRLTQITFSALGQQAPAPAKALWDPTAEKRKTIAALLTPLIPGYAVSIGGMTSIDITRSGIDKAYAIGKIEKELSVTKDDIIFVGDALFEGGNDFPVRKCGVECVEVKNPEDTAAFIKTMI